MKIYIQAIDFQLWRVITKGPQISTKRVDGINSPKDEEEWDDLKELVLICATLARLICIYFKIILKYKQWKTTD